MQWAVALQGALLRLFVVRRGFDFVNNVTVKEWLDTDCTKMGKAA
jgi:hypothetical protein